MNKFLKIVKEFFKSNGDEVHELTQSIYYHPEKGHLEKHYVSGYVWVKDVPESSLENTPKTV